MRIDKGDIIRQRGTKSRCLGADCGAGIWLLLEMLDMKKEGLYVFHLDEEIGGKGSDWITTYNKEFAEGIKYAVAFDRKSDHSIITNQWGPCCSDEFGKSLANEIGMGHVLDTTGRFTDTDNYKDIVPECTNVSVGYYNEHTPREYLDWGYLQRLRDAMLHVDVDNLAVVRSPKTYGYGTGRRGTGYVHHDDYWDTYNASIAEAKAEAARKRAREEAFAARTADENVPVVIKPPQSGMAKYVIKPGDATKTNIENIERLCSLNARVMARIFLDMGATYADVLGAFLNLDIKKPNVATEDANGDGWLSMIAKYILGGK